MSSPSSRTLAQASMVPVCQALSDENKMKLIVEFLEKMTPAERQGIRTTLYQFLQDDFAFHYVIVDTTFSEHPSDQDDWMVFYQSTCFSLGDYKAEVVFHVDRRAQNVPEGLISGPIGIENDRDNASEDFEEVVSELRKIKLPSGKSLVTGFGIRLDLERCRTPGGKFPSIHLPMPLGQITYVIDGIIDMSCSAFPREMFQKEGQFYEECQGLKSMFSCKNFQSCTRGDFHIMVGGQKKRVLYLSPFKQGQA